MDIDLDKVGRRGKLFSKLARGENTLVLTDPGGSLLTPTPQLGLYLTLTAGPLVEIVLATAGVGNTLTVVRGQDGTSSQNDFPAGTCVEAAWNRSQMAALIQSLSTANNASGYTGPATSPGVFTIQNGLVKAFSPAEGC